MAKSFKNACVYQQKVVVLRPPPPPKWWAPSKVRSHFAEHKGKGGHFSSSLTAFVLNVPIDHFNASINAPYAHLIHKIPFYWTKNARMFAYVQNL